MRIGIVCYPTFGGSGVVATELGMALANKGHEVHFVTYNQPVRLDFISHDLHFHEVLMEEYVPLGHSEFSSVVNKFKNDKPDVIFSTVVGDSVVALHKQYRAAGLDPEKMPMCSLTTSENEVAAMGGDAAAGHLTSAPYFMVHESAENEKFVSAYKKRWGSDKVTHFVSEPAYFGVGIFKQALEKIGKAGDINPTAIMEACKGQEIMAPQGKIKIDPDNLHCYLWPKIGICKSNGQYDIIRKTDNWLKPVPYAAYPDQTCTEGGLKKV